jgi:sugar phosphate isomerase/epimerase
MKDGRGSRENYVGAALGEGEIDLRHAVKCLKDAGYDGVWCAEYEGTEPTDIGYRKCADWLRANV